MKWLITYTLDYDQTRKQATIAASTYTQAYLEFSITYQGLILEIKKI